MFATLASVQQNGNCYQTGSRDTHQNHPNHQIAGVSGFRRLLHLEHVLCLDWGYGSLGYGRIAHISLGLIFHLRIFRGHDDLLGQKLGDLLGNEPMSVCIGMEIQVQLDRKSVV